MLGTPRPPLDDLCALSLCEQVQGIRSRQFSAGELVEAHFDRIARLDPSIGAFIAVDATGARETARLVDAGALAGRHLSGGIVTLKDIFAQAGHPNTAGLHPSLVEMPGRDSAVVARLRRAGVILIGRVNLHEFAAGMTTTNPHYGATHNPWSLNRIPGGSSGGSGAAVAAHFCAASVGTDTGGSTRLPAALCGVAGLKPTYGRISRAGMTALSWSLDTVGVLARTAEDCALMLGVLAGRDADDPSSARQPARDYLREADCDVRGFRIAVPRDFHFQCVEPGVLDAYERAIGVLLDHGCERVEVDLPTLPQAPAIQYLIGRAESAAAYPDLLDAGDRLGPEVQDRLRSGAQILAADYLRAQQGRTLLLREVRAILRQSDVFLCPATGTTALPIGATGAEVRGQWRNLADLYAQFTGPFSLTGNPVAIAPIGLDAQHLPIGIQVVGDHFEEGRALAVARVLERVLSPGSPAL